MINKINIRIYATVVKDRKVLALHEEYAGEYLMKFPGGGLEFGESVLECLHREFEEELNLKIQNIEHLYIYFQIYHYQVYQTLVKIRIFYITLYRKNIFLHLDY